ncbi:MAG: hypothetical protein KY468_12825 [Armatimonadetes bacterium]|nr:hypothetical protein [Armatimonadota bacterium]
MSRTADDELTSDSSASSEMIQKARKRVLELAEQQGVKPVERFEDLLGDFWLEEESIDDFIATVRAWRNEGVARELPE